ncbi:MAG: dipicolinate synthase subunit B [Oscillospiraceae bacterium]|jgi:dipicolinate synthase subunit B|nr:dipicolinate synthase subunit B [Oscillospiraceae bacterium]
MEAAERIGFALCGAFGAFKEAFAAAERLIESGFELTPVFSENAAGLDTRFGRGESHISHFEELCGARTLRTVAAAEDAVRKKRFGLLIIAPCTGNTLAKLARGIADSTVTTAVKSQLAAGRPALIAPVAHDIFLTLRDDISLLKKCSRIGFVPFRREKGEGEGERLKADFENIPEMARRMLAAKGLPVL